MRDTIYIDTYDNSRTTDIKKLLDADRSCTYTIKRLQDAINGLQACRLELAEQVQKVQSLEHKNVLTLRREKSYRDNKVYYFVELEKVFDGDFQSQTIFRECYPGTDRKKAADKFAALKKDHPGIETVINTAKARWEK